MYYLPSMSSSMSQICVCCPPDKFYIYGSVHCKNIQQDATLHSLFISGNCSTRFGWYHHPSSGAHTTVFVTPLLLPAAIAADSSNGVTSTRCYTVVCAPDDGLKYHPKRVEQFPDINKLCNVASCWIYEYIGILLGAYPILHISRIRFKVGAFSKFS
jgi:hypothetical protein